MTSAAHDNHCFVAIASGQSDEQAKHFTGWLNEVIHPALSKYDVKVAAASTEPISITTEIFEHLVFDPVAVFDLGGYTAEEPANPNVMYELGVRHAFGLPSVILAWKSQKLPFDVTDQRAVKIDRSAFYFKEARELITNFVANAKAGKFYHPLQSLANRASLDKAAESSDALQTVAAELTNLARKMDAVLEQLPAPFVPQKTLRTVQALYWELLQRQPPTLGEAQSLWARIAHGTRTAAGTSTPVSSSPDEQ
jgi:hypothetical protein